MSGIDRISQLPPLRDVIRDHGLQATKALGQNFLLDLNLTGSIAKLNGTLEGLDIIEIGPGPGGLTRALLQAGARHVHAIEYDPRAINALADLQEASDGRLTLHEADALSFDMIKLGEDGRRAVIANLPYNVATPILISLLREIHGRGTDAIAFMLLMFQKEVAERISATVDDKAYGRLAVMAQWLCDTKIVKILPPSAFTPPPKVHSAIVRFVPKKRQDSVSFDVMEKLVATAFGQRRKMLRSSLKAYAALLPDADIDQTARAEDVGVDGYVRLAKLVEGCS